MVKWIVLLLAVCAFNNAVVVYQAREVSRLRDRVAALEVKVRIVRYAEMPLDENNLPIGGMSCCDVTINTDGTPAYRSGGFLGYPPMPR